MPAALPADTDAIVTVAALSGLPAAPAARAHHVREDEGRHRVLHRRPRVFDRDDAAEAGRLKQVRDGPVAPVLRVELDHLPLGVWALQHLDGPVDGVPLAQEAHLDALYRGVDPKGAQRAALDAVRARAAVPDDQARVKRGSLVAICGRRAGRAQVVGDGGCGRELERA